MDFVPCCKWVSRGTVIGKPEHIQLSRQELEQVISESKDENEQQQESDDRYNMEQYEEEDGGGYKALSIGSLVNNDDMVEDQEDSDDEDEEIKPDDNLILVSKGYRDNSCNESIEIHVHNDNNNENYVHHDIMVPSCPLCFQLVPILTEDSSRLMCLIAAGLINSTIELYDINVINPVKPQAKLGSKTKNPEKGHSDAVLDMSWNKSYPHILASCSADKTVVLWDLETLGMSDKLDYFNGNVENIEWEEKGHCLLCCDSTGSIKMVDCREYDTVAEWKVKGEALVARFSSNNTNHFYIGTNRGRILCYDRRNNKALFKLSAHESDVTGISSIPGYNGLLVSTCVGGDIKLWDTNTSSNVCVFNKNLDCEQLHCFDMNPDNPMMGAFAGANKKGSLFSIINLNKKNSFKQVLDFRKLET